MDKGKKNFLKMIAVFLVAMLFMSCKERQNSPCPHGFNE
jgi:hypothetical protein